MPRVATRTILSGATEPDETVALIDIASAVVAAASAALGE